MKLIILPLLLLLLALPAHAFETKAVQAYVLDAQTGDVLFSKNPDSAMYPASMTKIMTAYLLFERLAENSLSLDTLLEVSEKAWRKGGSKMFVKLGDQVSVRDLLQGIVVQSGNDASIVLAEGIAGSEEEFAHIMNETAIRLGMTKTNFTNSTGWPDPAHITTARDLATLSRALIETFPDYYTTFAQRTFSYNGIKQSNRHPTLGTGGTDGIKTGYTKDSGYGIVISAKRGDRRLIVVLGGLQSDQQRARESKRILNWAFTNFRNYQVFSKGEVVVPSAKVWLGKTSVPLIAAEDLNVSLSHKQKRNLKVKTVYLSPLRAPIEAGDAAGEVVLESEGEVLKAFELVAGDSVAKSGGFSRVFKIISHWLLGR